MFAQFLTSQAGVIAAVRRGGTTVKVGNLPGGEVPVALGGIVTREITYRGSYRFVDEISDALRLMAEGVDVFPLMTHEVTLADALHVFELAAAHCIAVHGLVTWGIASSPA